LAERIIGIDLGTSNSAAAIIQGGKPTIIPSAEGQTAHGKAFPSVVAFPKDGSTMLVGTPAVNQAVTNSENTITKAKRKMGTDHIYKIQGKEYKPQQISAFILQKIKKDAEAFTVTAKNIAAQCSIQHYKMKEEAEAEAKWDGLSPEARQKILVGLIDEMVTLGGNIAPEDENKTWAELEHAIQDAIIQHLFGESKVQTTPAAS